MDLNKIISKLERRLSKVFTRPDFDGFKKTTYSLNDSSANLGAKHRESIGSQSTLTSQQIAGWEAYVSMVHAVQR